jgi:hypothetical protein
LVLEKKIFKGNAFLAHFGTLCALCALDKAVVHKKFVGAVVLRRRGLKQSKLANERP